MTAIDTGDIPSLSGASQGVRFFHSSRPIPSVRRICLGLVAAGLAFSLTFPAAASDKDASSTVAAGAASPVTPAVATPAVATEAVAARPHKLADFEGASAPADVRKMADWIVDSGNNRGVAFVIVEKPAAQVFVFDAKGKILGTAPCLIGAAVGDESFPGVGTMTLAQITPNMRTTPAGRFVAALGHDLGKLDVLWVDYPDAISLHRVVNNVRSERRPERLASPTPLDNRISWGCINVPAKFFDKVVEPAFTGTPGIVYILPEVKSIHEVFPTYYDVDGHSPLESVSLTAPAP